MVVGTIFCKPVGLSLGYFIIERIFNNDPTKITITSGQTDADLGTNLAFSPTVPITTDAKVESVVMEVLITLHNTYAGANNIVGGTFQMKDHADEEWTTVSGPITAFTSGDLPIDVEDGVLCFKMQFDVTTIVDNIDSNYDFRIYNIQAAQNNLEMFVISKAFITYKNY